MVRVHGMDYQASGSFEVKWRDMKYFLIYAVAYFGDTLMTNALCLNLKKTYPDCYIVYIVKQDFYDLVLHLQGVDEVWVYDKYGKHKGLSGTYSFIKKYKRKYDFDASFVTFSPLRGVLISKILGAKQVFTEYNSFLCRPFISNKKAEFKDYVHVQDRIAYLSELYSAQAMKSFKIRYDIPDEAQKFVDEKLLKNIEKPFILLNPVTKNEIKDLRQNLVVELVDLIEQNGYIPIMIGIGQSAEDYYKRLPEKTKNILQNFSNRTTIPQLAALLKRAKLLISADTGTAHLALATDTPLVDVFYRNEEFRLKRWAPKSIYCAESISNEKAFDVSYIWKKGKELIARCDKK